MEFVEWACIEIEDVLPAAPRTPHQAGLFEHAEMAGYGRLRDRKRRREFPGTRGAAREPFEDRAPGGVRDRARDPV